MVRQELIPMSRWACLVRHGKESTIRGGGGRGPLLVGATDSSATTYRLKTSNISSSLCWVTALCACVQKWVITTGYSPENLVFAPLPLFSLSVDCMHYATVVYKDRRGKSPLILYGVQWPFQHQYSLYSSLVNLTDVVDKGTKNRKITTIFKGFILLCWLFRFTILYYVSGSQCFQYTMVLLITNYRSSNEKASSYPLDVGFQKNRCSDLKSNFNP